MKQCVWCVCVRCVWGGGGGREEAVHACMQRTRSFQGNEQVQQLRVLRELGARNLAKSRAGSTAAICNKTTKFTPLAPCAPLVPSHTLGPALARTGAHEPQTLPSFPSQTQIYPQ